MRVDGCEGRVRRMEGVAKTLMFGVVVVAALLATAALVWMEAK